jgi:hypothetical protein
VHVGEAAHQESALVHPLLDAAEGELADLAATVENLRSCSEALGTRSSACSFSRRETGERMPFVRRAPGGQSRQAFGDVVMSGCRPLTKGYFSVALVVGAVMSSAFGVEN